MKNTSDKWDKIVYKYLEEHTVVDVLIVNRGGTYEG